MRIGKCDSCSKLRTLVYQSNFGICRSLCNECCIAANNVERSLTIPINRAEVAKQKYEDRKAEESKSVPSDWLKQYLEDLQ